MEKLILIGALVATSSSYALEHADIMEQHSWINRPDNTAPTLAGRIEKNSNIDTSSASTSAGADSAKEAVNSNIYTNDSHIFSKKNTSYKANTGYQAYTVNIRV